MKEKKRTFFTPFFNTIDRIIFGIKEAQEFEDHAKINEWLVERKSEEQEERVAVRSTN